MTEVLKCAYGVGYEPKAKLKVSKCKLNNELI